MAEAEAEATEETVLDAEEAIEVDMMTDGGGTDIAVAQRFFAGHRVEEE